MNKVFCPSVLCLCLGFAVTAGAQNPNQPPRNPQQQQQQQSSSQQVTLTGCLVKGGGAGDYVVTEQTSNEKFSFSGNAQLDKYVNQTVKLTGSVMTRESGEKVFQPDTIATVAPTCEGAPK